MPCETPDVTGAVEDCLLSNTVRYVRGVTRDVGLKSYLRLDEKKGFTGITLVSCHMNGQLIMVFFPL